MGLGAPHHLHHLYGRHSSGINSRLLSVNHALICPILTRPVLWVALPSTHHSHRIFIVTAGWSFLVLYRRELQQRTNFRAECCFTGDFLAWLSMWSLYVSTVPVSWVNIRHNHNVRSLIRPENRLLTEIATIAIFNVNNDNYLFYVCVEQIREKKRCDCEFCRLSVFLA